MYHVDSARRLESVPLVVDGVMYFTNPNEVYALDARTARDAEGAADGQRTALPSGWRRTCRWGGADVHD